MSGIEEELTAKEKERYDRQIRVWGAEAQSRIQKSKVLVCGLCKLNVEVVKNIVLAGMNVTIQDSDVVGEDDLSYNFFLSEGDIGKSRAEAALSRIKDLNSFATIESETRPLSELGDEFFAQYSVILLSGKQATEDQAIRIDNICRSSSDQQQQQQQKQQQQRGSCFFWSDVFGENAIFYSDFGESFQYKEDPKPQTAATANSTTTDAAAPPPPPPKVQTAHYPSIKQVLDKKWSAIPMINGKDTSRHFPLSLTFIKHRILNVFRETYGSDPSGEQDWQKLQAILQQLQARNGVFVDATTTVAIDRPTPGATTGKKRDASVLSGLGEMMLDEAALRRLGALASCVSVSVMSVLGSYLSQEVVKAVSQSGCPAASVFVFSADDFQAKAFPVEA